MKKEKSYTTYEQTADREYTCQADTRTEQEWFIYYLLYVDKEEYRYFVDWLADMIKSGNLIKEK